MSAASKGAYWKLRTKRWLEARGYQVAFMERVHWIQTDTGRVPVKKDQLGSDLLAVSRDRIVFVQVKGGKTGRSNLAAGRTTFAQFVFPAGTQQWVVMWKPRAREPEIVVVSEGPCGTFTAPVAPVRRRRAALPLLEATP
jgi:hypothetical protein